MSEVVTGDTIVRRMHRERDAFEAIIDRMTPDQVANLPVVGFWTMRDVIAHLIAHEQRALDELRSALRGETLAIDHSTAATDAFNAAAAEGRQHQSLDEVHAAWTASFDDVVAAVSALPTPSFDPDGPVCTALGDTIDGALANNTYGHYAGHGTDIQRVLAEVG